MIYACNKCRFLFESEKEPERCPDCGKFEIREATDEEIAEFEARQHEYSE